MTDEEREKVKAKAITMEITANGLKKALDGTNPVGLFFKSRKAYGFYRSFQRYSGDTKEELWERMEKAGLTACDVERLLGFNRGLRLKGKPFMDEVQEKWVNEWLDMRQEAVKGNGEAQRGKDKAGKRGRPATTFASLMVGDENGGRLARIHEVMKGKKGKGVALVILACMRLGWLIEKPTFRQIEDEFGDVGTKQAFNNAMAKQHDQIEIQAAEAAIKGGFTEIGGGLTFDVVEEI